MTNLIKSAALGLTMLAFAGGSAFAQGMMSSDSSMGSQKMSASDMKAMKKCQGMSHDMMMKSSKCTKMMKMHPDMMNNNGAMSQ